MTWLPSSTGPPVLLLMEAISSVLAPVVYTFQRKAGLFQQRRTSSICKEKNGRAITYRLRFISTCICGHGSDFWKSFTTYVDSESFEKALPSKEYTFGSLNACLTPHCQLHMIFQTSHLISSPLAFSHQLLLPEQHSLCF